MKLIHTKNNAYDMMLLVSDAGKVIGAYDYDPDEFQQAKERPNTIIDWHANYPDNTYPDDYGTTVETIQA